jgi:chitin disaccharide deacetylase
MRSPLVVHADDLGLSREFNQGIRLAATHGVLTSTCIRTNGPAFDEAVREIIPDCPTLGLGLHLNIVEGRTGRRRVPRTSPLCSSDGFYQVGFAQLLWRHRDHALLEEVERDFRDQIETAFRILPRLDHLNSHQHSHAVPRLFELTCRLALEYGVPFVRLPRERFYVAGPATRHLNRWYAINLAKAAVLRSLSRENARLVRRYGIGANEWFVGIAYTGHMDQATVLRGLEAVPATAGVVEVLLHPCSAAPGPGGPYLDAAVRDYVLDPARARELNALLDPALVGALSERWCITCYGQLAATRSAAPASPASPCPDLPEHERSQDGALPS